MQASISISYSCGWGGTSGGGVRRGCLPAAAQSAGRTAIEGTLHNSVPVLTQQHTQAATHSTHTHGGWRRTMVLLFGRSGSSGMVTAMLCCAGTSRVVRACGHAAMRLVMVLGAGGFWDFGEILQF